VIVSRRTLYAPDAMPMNPRPIILHIVRHAHLHPVAPISVDSRTWILAVDEKHWPLDTVRRTGGVPDFEDVGPRNAGFGPGSVGVGVDIITAGGPAVALVGSVDAVGGGRV